MAAHPGGRILGADFAYIGSAFIATAEANAVEGYKQISPFGGGGYRLFESFHRGGTEYLKPSIVAAGMIR